MSDYDVALFNAKRTLGAKLVRDIVAYFQENDMDPLDGFNQRLVKEVLKSLIDSMPDKTSFKPEVPN